MSKKKIEDLDITESQKENLRKSVAIRMDTDNIGSASAEAYIVDEWLSRQGLDTDNGGSILG